MKKVGRERRDEIQTTIAYIHYVIHKWYTCYCRNVVRNSGINTNINTNITQILTQILTQI